ncbi:polysaccharide biosynthesis C-terminal domain-containing protein [Nonomuraea pusilla]|uniref:polysaccharide biosynthesis C-terminal domain-containing protein n=1 Tax=Nonomuraea pusilla TaxID=46177 RepID=UPI00331779A7
MISAAALLRAAVPLFLAMVTGLAGSLVVTSALGRHDTVTLAAFAVMTAVLNPASTAVAGALRGLGPFVARYRDDPAAAVPVLRDARWLSLLVGALGAAAVLCVPLLAGAAGVPSEVVRALGPLPWFLAAYLMVYAATGGAGTVLVALGRGREVLWASLANTVVLVALTFALVPSYGLTGVGVAWLLGGVAAAAVSALTLRRALGRPIGRGRPRPVWIARLARVSLPLAATVLIKFGVLGVVTFAAGTTSARDAAAHAVLNALSGVIMLASLAVAQAAVPEVARASDAAGARRVNGTAALLAVAGTGAGSLGLLVAGDLLLPLFSDDPAVRGRVLALLPLMLLAAALDAAQAVHGMGLTALRKSGVSLLFFAAGYGALVVAAVPVARTWGLTGLWAAVAVANLVLFVLQGAGFRRHCARWRGEGAAGGA